MMQQGTTAKSGIFFMACVCILLVYATNINAQESMRFDSEAKKLEFIRDMLLKEKHLRLSEHMRGHCVDIMKDLLSGNGFQAIEPYVRADSADDPRLEKWSQCRQHDYHDFDIDPKQFFGWLPQLGAPPYRYYRIELDGNLENGPEDLIYHESPDRPTSTTSTGYTWVDLKNCEIKHGGFSATGARSKISKKPNAIYLNTLVRYRGYVWAIDYVEGFGLNISRWVNREGMEICQWWLFAP
jgi:hypothetical protein